VILLRSFFLLLLPLTVLASDAKVEFFEKKIRPVLAQECYECHSAAGKKKAGLVLDSRPGWQAGGESGDVIVPGNAGVSLLMASIRHTHEDLKMPKNGARLDDSVLADFERWINDGAVDPRDKPPSAEEITRDTDWQAVLARRKQWWAFQPVAVSAKGPQSVDAFLNEGIQQKGLKPSARAEDAVVLRRLHMVLTGLPPSFEEVAEFEKQCKANRHAAVEKKVDELLKSPHFGEKWARHWMDWVRYAESYGSEGDPAIPYAWRYRDYLIRAFNADVPYPQMLKEAIAGDLLPQPRLNRELSINESAIGVAQLRMVLHGFSPTDSLDEMVTFTDNQIDTVSKAFQGMTLSCARCHNHKFDALSQTDFYAWFGVFSSTHPGVLDVKLPQPEVEQRLLSIKETIRQEMGREWLKSAEKLPVTKAPAAEMGTVAKESWCKPKAEAGDFSLALSGSDVLQRVYPAGIVSDLITDRSRTVALSPSRKCDGGTLWVRCAGGGGARVRYIVQNYPRTGTIHKALDFNKPEVAQFRWRKLDLSYWKGDTVFLECNTAADRPVETSEDARSWFAVSDVQWAAPGAPEPKDEPAGGHPVEAIQRWMKHQATSADATLIQSLLSDKKLPNTSEGALAKLVDEYRKMEQQLAAPVRVPGVLEDRGVDAPLFTQGDHKRPADVVKRRFLEAIRPEPFKTEGSGRLQLAEAMVDEKNPLTSRVIVNRLWHHVFGQGLVTTVDNFGRLGKLPSHPALLDWMASEFKKSGGSMKDIIRRLVLTEAFARASGSAAEDPENVYLAHWKVRRVEAEAVRDTMLHLSGELSPELYGEPVNGGSNRRSVYVQVIRNRLDPLLSVFDMPVPFATRGNRDSTNVPAQALALMNDAEVKSWARSWATRTLDDGKLTTDEVRVTRMLAQLTGREPTEPQRAGALALVQSARAAQVEYKRQLAQMTQQEAHWKQQRSALLKPARDRLMAARDPAEVATDAPVPYAEWDFEKGTEDLHKRLPLKLEGSARIEGGALVLDGKGSLARSVPLPRTIKQKTFEAWVQLDDLNQQGGGVMTLQDRRGDVFDSLVFAEKQPGAWVAGSDHFKRSEQFDAPAEKDAEQRPVHVAVVWNGDGKTTGYRDGERYGNPYNAKSSVEFTAGQSELLLGCRHGAPSGNRVLKGRILRARLYDRALKPAELALSSKLEGAVITEREVLAALSKTDQEQAEMLKADLDELTPRLQALRASDTSEESVWAALAQSLFSLKEMIYLR
jgi:hypothetical protein